MNQSFSKIWISIIVLVLIGGGFFVWKNPEFKNPFTPPININLNENFNLKIGQTASIGAENIKIKFVKVLEDSRGPFNAQYAYEGQAVILLDIFKNNQNIGSLSLIEKYGQEDLAIRKINGYSIKLLSLTLPEERLVENSLVSAHAALLSISKISEETADWQIYRNEQYKFEFKYPAEIIFKNLGRVAFQIDSSVASVAGIFTVDGYYFTEKGVMDKFQLMLFGWEEKPGDFDSLEQYLTIMADNRNKRNKTQEGELFIFTHLEKFDMGNLHGLALVDRRKDSLKYVYKEIFFEKPNYFFGIEYNYPSALIEEFDSSALSFQDELNIAITKYNLIQDIISTFRFLE